LLKGVVSRHSRVLPAVSGTPDWSLSDGGGDVKLVLTESAKLNGLDPEDYLRRVLTCVTDHPVRQMHELLPWNMAKVRCRLDQREAA
jgi:transposase